MAKASAVEKEARIIQLMDWIIEGTPDYKLKSKIKASYNIQGRQAARYITEAFDRWKSESNAEIETKRNSRVDELKAIAQDLSDSFKNTPAGIRTLLAVKKEISKLEGIYPSKRIQLSGDSASPVKIESKTDLSLLSDEVLEAIIAAQNNA